ncbi:Cgi121p NDAI_0C00770 [Naumovozyma dairenensis CBS 421]|uniref:EKC/KEOPS complex subunit CGI121 n=1 Tax=Naumovozyma dairenensis (strain ATCC 10597 / BCRC 20456 / CBS 421 / NBRC 0211 / NRRL Y-12639) TaxID=1071378 RepID=G0W7H7_NAUDC|nr:hypothetical protein NDAI_0C00770 [Naumovozyma dairenensis CBS 421]CCD23738.1 hypothetical protein NDAI_0C00770 [Naumovozyma dairenensis CBS 421]
MTLITIPQFPEYNVSITLFKDVTNSKVIRSHIADSKIAFLDAKLIVSTEQVYSAIYKALIENKYNRLRTKTILSECLFCLSPTSNIGDAFKKFGIKDDSKNVICLKVLSNGESLDDVNKEVLDVVDGTMIEFNDDNLKDMYDVTLVRKIYKLEKDFQPATTTELSRALVNAIQIRGL